MAAIVWVRKGLFARLPAVSAAAIAGGVAAWVLLPVLLAAVDRSAEGILLDAPPGYRAELYLVNEAGGPDGLAWHRSLQTQPGAGPDGLIANDDVVLIKVNGQWSERGGTNTDVLRGVIRQILEHPDGFIGEIVVADNGQGIGSLDRAESNAEDPAQSVQDVVDEFVGEGWQVSTFRWDTIRATEVGEYSAGDANDGYVVAASPDPETQIKVSYPKFRTSPGTSLSYRFGVWSPSSESYDPEKLVVINIPVFKTHSTYAITASVKNHMGVVTQSRGTDSHNAVGRGGMGSVLAEVRLPDLTILDCIWILARPGRGPSASYEDATRRDQLVASTDPVALDAWATQYIMIPAIIENGYSWDAYHGTQDPDNPDSVFRRYLDRSMNELLLAGIDTTNDPDAVDLHVWPDSDADGIPDDGSLSRAAGDRQRGRPHEHLGRPGDCPGPGPLQRSTPREVRLRRRYVL
jgi:uncharacterized protein (DUF362 family)